MNRRKAKEEAARNSNAARRRAAEEKVAEEMSKRKSEMTEEEYKKALEYVQTTKDVDEYIGDTSSTKEYSDEEQKLRRKLDREFATSSRLGAAVASISSYLNPIQQFNTSKAVVDAAAHATKQYFADKKDKEREAFFNQFTPDAFSKAQAKYDPIKPQEVKGGAQ